MPELPRPVSKAHFEVLDGLRGSAALLIVVFHAFNYSFDFQGPWALVPHAYLAVDFFFALSGFVVAFAYDDRWSSMTIPQFFRLRLIRLHPLVLLGATLGLAVYLFDPYAPAGDHTAPLQLALVYLMSLLLLPSPAVGGRPDETQALNGPAWSLMQEYIGNVAYAFVLRRLRAAALALIVGLAAIGLAWAAQGTGSLEGGWDYPRLWMAPLRLATSFVLGLWLFRVRSRFRLPKVGLLALSLLLLLCFQMPAFRPAGALSVNGLYDFACVLLLFPLIILCGAHSEAGRGMSGLCRFSGRLSYPLYITHIGFVYVLAHYAQARRPGTPAVIAAILCVIALSVAVAWLVLTRYDEPLRARLAKRRGPHIAPTAHQTLRPLALLLILSSLLEARPAAAAAAPLPAPAQRPRLFVLTDIGNEPDDQMSLVRLMTYSNSLDIEGLVACTSTWKRNVVSPETLRSVIEAYGKVRDNLLRHESGYPTAAALLALVSSGRAAYGLAGVADGPPSQGALRLLAAARRDDERPLWIALWGGASTLAEALREARRTLDAGQLAALVARLRVYSISDQDDAGPWIRREFPSLTYIVKPSTEDGGEYASATWTGISGDLFYRNGEGADSETITQEWLQANIRSKGPLGAHYPRHMFIMEGDTPSFLGLIPNGLDSDQSPSWGGWGGRYVLRQPYGETRPIWTQGGDSFPRVTSADTVIGIDGRAHTSDQATIWRWRRAFQNDFAARMDWTIRDFAHANHAPRVVVDGDASGRALTIDVDAGHSVTLDATGTSDPDGDAMDFDWFQYSEAGFGGGVVLASVTLEQARGARAVLHAEATCQPNWLGLANCGREGVVHVVLAVTDHGQPALTRYRRVIVHVHYPPAPPAAP